jgi:manganese-dependent inorganic pyrophosphatase
MMAALLTAMPMAASAEPDSHVYRDLLRAVNYGDAITYVIGHKNPDSDAVGSAIAYAYLLNEIGIPAEAAISGPVNNETGFALDFFGIEAPPVIDNAAGKQFVLVDQSAYSQAIDGMAQARIVGIVDHHGIGDVSNSEFINVRSAPVGATASLVYQTYMECEVPIPRDMARVMLMSLLSDTRNMARNVTAIDRDAFDRLKEIADIADPDAFYQQMAEAIASYGDMSEWEIFRSDYKEYNEAGFTFGIADVNAFGEKAVRAMADRMHQVMEERYESMGLDMLYTIVNNKGDDESENMMYMTAYGEGAAETLQEAYGNNDGALYFIFKDNLSRKKDIVPAIVDVLEKKQK